MKYNFLQRMIFFIVTLFCSLTINGQQTFSMEEQGDHSVSPSKAVWNILKKYAEDFDCGRPQKDWFQISAINIDSNKIPDLVAYPKKNCIQGSNITTFFVFKGIGKNKHKLVLKAGAYSISISKTNRTHRNIEAYSFVGQRIMIVRYAFRANTYRKVSVTYEEPGANIEIVPAQTPNEENTNGNSLKKTLSGSWKKPKDAGGCYTFGSNSHRLKISALLQIMWMRTFRIN